MRSMNQGRGRRSARPPAVRAYLRMSEGAAELDFARTSTARRIAALSLALLFLAAVPLLWATSASGGDQQATVPTKSGSNSGPGSGDDDEGAGDGDDSTAGDVTTSADTANTAGTTNDTGDATTTVGPEDTDTGATNTTVGENGTTDSTGTTDGPGMTDTGTTGGDLVIAANGKVRAGAPIKITANCADCDVSLRAVVKGPSSDGDVRARTKKVNVSLGAEGKKVKLKLRGAAKAEIKEAAQDGKFMKRARVVVKAKADTSGGKQSEKLKLKLK